MRAEGNAMTAVQAENRFSRFPIQLDSAYRAGVGAITAAQAKFPPVAYPSSPAFTQGTAGTDGGTGRLRTGQAVVGLKAGSKPSPGTYTYPGTGPGEGCVHHTSTGKHTGVTADTTFHRYSFEHFSQNKNPPSSFFTSACLIIFQAPPQAQSLPEKNGMEDDGAAIPLHCAAGWNGRIPGSNLRAQLHPAGSNALQ